MDAHGHFRGTGDLVIFINATETNADKMMRACQKFGIEAASLKLEMFLVPKMIGIGDPPLRIEVLKQLGVVDFKYVFQRKRVKEIDGLLVNVVGVDDLILLKKAAIKDRNEARDAEDLTFLEKLKAKLK